MSTPDLPGPGTQPGPSGGTADAPGAQPGTVPPGAGGPDPVRGGPAGPTDPGQTPPHGSPQGPGGTRPSGTDGFFDAVRRVGVYRSDDRWIGGVASGVAERFGIDPLIVRGLLFVTFFLSGAGLVLYGAAWALLPERRDGRIHLQEAFRGNVDVALLGAAAFVVVGFSWGGGWWSWWDTLHLGWLTGLFWVAAFVTVAVVVVSALTQRGPRGPQGAPPPAPPWAGGPGAPGTGGPGAPGYGPSAPGHGPAGPGYVPPAPGGAAPTDAPWGSPGTPAGGPPSGPQDRVTWSAEASPYASTAPGATAPVPPYAPGAPLGTTTPPAPQAAASPRVHQGPRNPAAQQPPRPPRAPHPPKPPRPRGPGATTTGVVVGLSLLIGAFLLVVDRQGELPWPVFLTWAGLSGILAGLAIVVSGLRGRTSGGLGWLAVLLLVVALPASAWRSAPFTFFLDDSVRTVTDGTHRVTDPDVAEEGFGVTFGDPTIDLSGLDLSDASGTSPVEVPIQLGAGDATVVVPDGVPVRAEVQVLAGNARWLVDGDRQEIGGVSTRPVTFDNDEVQSGDDPLLVLQVEVGAGQITIEEN
ncbi:phage shock protein PspC (stress-responsive transcriptional regulator) [Cellulosimicrobium cellulans]|uniref:PspC domain-containing protein n=1 Tax=Cellulosimicrobium cellulans TaxID=1710 RepID=UPI001956549F|nr:PspC domain-containing protein [Cellulosimicrobium cellulans]MBM7819023.1 phage shock protein PspC (stress-responsive transcriptional regulator) [Cellulosimicrobium cellulans]